MERLNRAYLEKHMPGFVEKNDALPVKILQFGEGKFIRAFIAYVVQKMNDNGVFNGRMAAVQPVGQGGILEVLQQQDYYYTVMHRGMVADKAVEEPVVIGSIAEGIQAVQEWRRLLQMAGDANIQVIISNTTEAGLEYLKEDYTDKTAPVSYPGKLTAWLYERYQQFEGADSAGVVIIPCELVEHNGDVLKERIRQKIADWNLPEAFKNWVFTSCSICSTLVDRIVTGTPFGEEAEISMRLGYQDDMLTTCEPYFLFVINGNERAKKTIPFHESGLQAIWEDEKEYREIKVKFLNGAHTLMCAAALVNGVETVGDVMKDTKWRTYVETGVYEEINPVIYLPEDKKEAYIASIFGRFENPYVRHMLKDIAMNGVSKYRERLLPTFKAYVEKFGKLPENLTYTLSAILYMYRNSELLATGIRFTNKGQVSEIKENPVVIEAFQQAIPLETDTFIDAILSNAALWGEDLTAVAGLREKVAANMRTMG